MALMEYEHVVVFWKALHNLRQKKKTAGEAEEEVTFQMCTKQLNLHHRQCRTWILIAVFFKK